MLELEVSPRHLLGKKAKALRRQKLVPANIYGMGRPSQAVQVSLEAFLPVLKRAGRHAIVELRRAGEDRAQPVLIRRVQKDPVTDAILHVDFQQVSLVEKLHVELPIVLEGQAPAVRVRGGILTQTLSALEVECLPGDIPSQVVVDLAALEDVGASIRLRDLILPPRVRPLADGELVVVHVEAPAKVEEAPPPEEAPAPAVAEEAAEE